VQHLCKIHFRRLEVNSTCPRDKLDPLR
jgi:hypothetical protein